jgi:hypothetical protein
MDEKSLSAQYGARKDALQSSGFPGIIAPYPLCFSTQTLQKGTNPMTGIALHKGDQERVVALLILTLVLPWLPAILPRTLSFILVLIHLEWERRIMWRRLAKDLLAPLGFLSLSSLALFWGHHENIVDLFSKSLFACMLLLLMSRSLAAPQWMALAQSWKLDALIFTLILVSKRWLELSTDLWKNMNQGWAMRSQLSGIRNSVKLMGWRLAGVIQLQEIRVAAMDVGWQARGLPPILSLPPRSRVVFHWSILLRYLAAPLFIYTLGLLMLRGYHG